MNKNNGALMAIVGLLVIIIGTIIIVTVTKKDPVAVTIVPNDVAVAVPTEVAKPAPVVEAPYVEPIVTAPATPVKVPAKTPVVKTRITGQAPLVTTTGTTSLSAGGVVLHGMLSTNNAETYYSFEYGTTQQFGTSTRFAPIDGSSSQIEITLAASQLNPSTTYYYRANAQNAFGKAQGAIKTFTTSGTNGTIVVTQPVPVVANSTDPNAPGVMTQEASSISNNSAVLNGQLNTHGVETYYSFQYGTTQNLGMETRVAPIAGSASISDVSLAIVNLSTSTNYYYRLHAHNQYGATYSTTNRFITAQQ